MIAAQDVCSFRLRDEAVAEYVRSQGWDAPGILSRIHWWAGVQRRVIRDGLSPAECAMSKQTAETIGILD